MHANVTTGLDPRVGFGLLTMATALLLVTHPPKIPELDSSALALGGPAMTEQVMEWRPQGPPPWGDVDQFSPDEVEESSALASGDRARDEGSTSRARPAL